MARKNKKTYQKEREGISQLFFGDLAEMPQLPSLPTHPMQPTGYGAFASIAMPPEDDGVHIIAGHTIEIVLDNAKSKLDMKRTCPNLVNPENQGILFERCSSL